MGNMFFTRIKNPTKFRRTVLESSKEIIGVLKDYQMVLKMRHEKEAKIQHLTQQFDELKVLLEQIETYVPEDAMKQLEEMMPKPKPAPKPKKPRKKAVSKKSTKKASKKKEEPKEEPKEPSELDKLNSALSHIDDKLSKI